MNRNCLSGLRRAAIVAGTVLTLLPALPGQTLNWIGGSGTANWNTSSNWTDSTPLNSGTTWDLVMETTNDASPVTSMIPGGNFTIRSLSIDNTTQLMGNASGVLRFVATTASNSTAERTITFGTAGVSIITLTNNVNMNVNSSTLATNPGTPKMTLNLGYSGNGTIDIDGSSQLTVTGGNALITGTGGLIKTGDGTLRLSGNHAFEGGFTLQAGSVIVTTSGSNNSSAVTASPWGTGTLTLLGGTIDSSSTNGRTVRNHTILNGNVTLSTSAATSGNITWSDAAGQSTTLAGNSELNITQTVNWSQDITGGAFNLTKSGSGTLRVNGTNTYSGVTTVSAGTLELNGSLAGGLNVESGALFTGAGSVGGAATFAGTHNPGNSPGIQTFGSDVTYQTGATVNWELNANTAIQGDTANFDQVIVGGTLDFTGATLLNLSFNGAGSTVNWSDDFWSTDHSWQVYDAAALANFDNLGLVPADWLDSNGVAFSTLLSGATFSLALDGSDVLLSYTAAAIPEPSTYAALFGALALGLVAYRRRRAATPAA